MTDIEEKAKILIVEDEVLIAADLESRLKGMGYKVCGNATTGKKALELVEQNQPDLVIMDIVLQGDMDGIDAAEVIRDKWSIPVVFLTAYADQDRLERAKLTYPFGYLLKPFQDRDLKITIEMARYVAKVDAERRTAEKSLCQANQFLESIIENIPSLVFIKDAKELRFVRINKALEETIGVSRSELYGKNDYDFAPKEQADFFTEKDRLVLKEKKPVEIMEEPVQTPEKGERILHTRKVPLLNQEGQAEYLLGISDDITERKQAEKARRENEAAVRNKLKAILEPESDLGVLALEDIIDVPAVRSLMENFHRITGMGSAIVDNNGKVLVGVGWQDICTKFHRCHPETLKNCVESDTVLALGAEPGKFKSYLCKNGMWDMASPIGVSGRHMGNIYLGQFIYSEEEPDVERFRDQARQYGFDETEYLAALSRVPRYDREMVEEVMAFYSRLAEMISSLSFRTVSLSRTLTERKQAEEEIRKFKAITDNAIHGSAITDLQGDILYVNDYFARAHGYSPEELIGKNIAVFHHERQMEEVKVLVQEVLKNGQFGNTEVWHAHRKGGEFPMLMSAVVIKDENDVPKYLAATAVDITERRRIEEALIAKEARHRAILDAFPGMLNAVDCDFNVISASKQLIERTGHNSLEDVVGGKCYRLWKKREAVCPECGVVNALATGQPFSRLCTLEEKELTGINSDLHIAPITDNDGITTGAVEIMLDMSARLQAEAALKESKEKYRRLFELESDAIFLIDSNDGQILEANKAAEKFYGFSRDEILRCKNTDLSAEPDQTCQATKGGLNVVPIRWHKKKDGSIFPVEITATHFNDLEGRQVHIEAIRDISWRIEAEEKLLASEAQKNAILNNSLDSIRLVDKDMRIIWSNRVIEEQTGKNREEIIGDFCYKVFTGRNKPCPNCPTLKAGQTGKTEHSIIIEENVKGIPGTSYWADYAVPIKDESGDIVNFLQVSRDITDLKNTEQALRESDTLFRLQFELGNIGITIASPQKKWLHVNQRLCEMIGYSAEELKQTTWSALTHPDDLAADNAQFQRMVDGVIDNYEIGKRFIRKDGTVIFMHLSCACCRNQDGTLRFTIGSLLDITDRKRAEEEKEKLQAQLIQARKMESIGILVGGIAHEFNNLLQAINGHAELLLLNKTKHDPDFSSLDAIQKSGDKAADLIHQLLLFSRKSEPNRRLLKLNQEIEQAKRILERTIPKIIEIEVHHGGSSLWEVAADPVQIRQVLLNLGSNAAHAMQNGGKLVIETDNITLNEDYAKQHPGAEPGRYALLSVSDTGHGMDKETMENIFEPFFTTKEIGQGTGLGLASVYGIVKSHGGYITCYSEFGQGTMFKIYLPAVVQPEIEEREDVEDKPIPRGTETILLVDDEEAIRGFAEQALVKFGYSVMTASTGEEGLEVYQSKSDKIDLVITDIGMPGMGGHKFLREVIQFNPAAKIIIASGYSINGNVKRSMDEGARGYVGKPFQLADLLNTVREVLDS